MPAGFEEHRGFEEHDGVRVPGLRRGDVLLREAPDLRPDDVGQPLELRGIAEHLAAQGAAVDGAVLRAHVGTERLDHGPVRRRTRFVGAVPEAVGVDDMGAKGGEMAGRGGFAGRDAAGEADDQGSALGKSRPS